MTTTASSLSIMIKRAVFLFVMLSLFTMSSHANYHVGSQGREEFLGSLNYSLAGESPSDGFNGDDSKKEKNHSTHRYMGAPPGLHYIALFALFFFIMLIVSEQEAKTRQFLLLPVILSFVIYKVLFLMEENTALDAYMKRLK